MWAGPEVYAGWGLASVYLVGFLIVWTAVIMGLLVLIQRLGGGHDPAPVSRYEDRPRHRNAA
jgi:hypothetical protein